MNLPIQKTKNKFTTGIIILAILSLCAISYIGIFTWHFLNTPYNTNASAMAVEIPAGSSLPNVSKILQERGLIKNANTFNTFAKFKNAGKKIQAGTFLLSPAWTPSKILHELMYGKELLSRITIREGLPWWTVAELLEQEGFCKAADFKKVIHDPAFLEHHGIPFKNAEGFLYPDTYFIPKPKEMNEDAARKVADRLINTFWQKTKPSFSTFTESGRPNSKTLEEILTLASVVERETRVNEERARVAGVYMNRLNINMRLQADPTVIYGLGTDYTGTLYTKHLENRKNPYNTYRHYGLPPGPICSPSLASIDAALAPESHDYYYFVATGIGIDHVFSKNLKNHNRAVQQYRRNLKMNDSD